MTFSEGCGDEDKEVSPVVMTMFRDHTNHRPSPVAIRTLAHLAAQVRSDDYVS